MIQKVSNVAIAVGVLRKFTEITKKPYAIQFILPQNELSMVFGVYSETKYNLKLWRVCEKMKYLFWIGLYLDMYCFI